MSPLLFFLLVIFILQLIICIPFHHYYNKKIKKLRDELDKVSLAEAKDLDTMLSLYSVIHKGEARNLMYVTDGKEGYYCYIFHKDGSKTLADFIYNRCFLGTGVVKFSNNDITSLEAELEKTLEKEEAQLHESHQLLLRSKVDRELSER